MSSTPSWLSALGRIANGVMDAINRYKAQKATDNVADTIANDGIVHKSEQSFTSLSDKDGSDTTE